MTTSLTEPSLLDDCLTPLWLSIYLSDELPDASVDYQYAGNTHRFLIQHHALSYELELDDCVLETMEMEDLTSTLGLVIDRVRRGTASHRFNVRGIAVGAPLEGGVDSPGRSTAEQFIAFSAQP